MLMSSFLRFNQGIQSLSEKLVSDASRGVFKVLSQFSDIVLITNAYYMHVHRLHFLIVLDAVLVLHYLLKSATTLVVRVPHHDFSFDDHLDLGESVGRQGAQLCTGISWPGQ